MVTMEPVGRCGVNDFDSRSREKGRNSEGQINGFALLVLTTKDIYIIFYRGKSAEMILFGYTFEREMIKV